MRASAAGQAGPGRVLLLGAEAGLEPPSRSWRAASSAACADVAAGPRVVAGLRGARSPRRAGPPCARGPSRPRRGRPPRARPAPSPRDVLDARAGQAEPQLGLGLRRARPGPRRGRGGCRWCRSGPSPGRRRPVAPSSTRGSRWSRPPWSRRGRRWPRRGPEATMTPGSAALRQAPPRSGGEDEGGRGGTALTLRFMRALLCGGRNGGGLPARDTATAGTGFPRRGLECGRTRDPGQALEA